MKCKQEKFLLLLCDLAKSEWRTMALELLTTYNNKRKIILLSQRKLYFNIYVYNIFVHVFFSSIHDHRE